MLRFSYLLEIKIHTYTHTLSMTLLIYTHSSEQKGAKPR